MSIKNRMPKINKIAQSPTTRLIHKRNAYKLIYHVDSVRTGKPYQVTMEWSKDGDISVLTGSLYTFDHKEARDGNHPANNNGTICYQVLGVAKKMAQEKGKQISFCENKKSAFLVSQFGGEIIVIRNPAQGEVWGVVKSKEDKKQSFQNRVNLLRGEEEEGID